MFCKAFSKSLVIDPSFQLQVCCSDMDRMLETKLEDVESLSDFFYNSEKYAEIRKQAASSDLISFKPCYACHRSAEGFKSEMDVFNRWRFPDTTDENELKYLEVTTSNICKQSCVMCGSWYSSTHAKLAGRPQDIKFMSEEQIEKIYSVLPTIEYLNIKGGEPFADQNNLKILEKLAECNPNVKDITIVSNGNHISDAFKEVLCKFDPEVVKISFSIDGYDDVYTWQRGTSYQKTVDTINKFYDDTKITYMVQTTATVYTLPTLAKAFDRHMDDLNGLRSYNSTNIVWTPAYTSPALFIQKTLDKFIVEIMEKEPKIRWDRQGIDLIKTYPHNDHLLDFFEHTKKWNEIRGLDIFDLVPELEMVL